jgi:multidrug efflux pump subunit AcrA (membrane-fusion protein)
VVHLSAGQEVRLTADARGLVIPALIERIAPAVDPSTGTVKVTLAVSDESAVRPGAFVRVDIVTDTHDEALVVPRPALVAEGRRWLLFRMDEDDRVKQLEVRLGYEEGERVEILEVTEPAGVLAPGTPIVVAGAPALTDGALVRIIENGQEEDDSEDEAGVTP